LPTINISVDYDVYAERDPSDNYIKYDEQTGLIVGAWEEKYVGTHRYRSAFRFPLAALPADATVTGLRFGCQGIIAGGASHETDVHPYGSDGQDDPEADGAQNCYDRCAEGSAYVDNSTALRSTGWKWFDLPAAAITDLQNAKSAVNRFSIGLHEEGDNDPYATIESLRHPDPNEAILEITYTVPAVGYQYTDGLVTVITG